MAAQSFGHEGTGQDPDQPAIDRAHLARMTGGDATLEREVLALFASQAAVLTRRMQEAEPGAIAALAHTLKGAALGIGAHAVAAAAEQVERVGPGREDALARLAAAAAGARAAIAAMLARGPE
jgi:HPt (histidine-containing phosphotransfer) domain-containing protein